MTIEDMPVYNDDGSVKFTLVLNENQKKTLLQFALNFLLATGLAANYGIDMPDAEEPVELND